jgi:ankyrin repeat protein
MSFAVQENQVEMVAFLLRKGADPINSGTNDTLLTIAQDRGYTGIQALLEPAIAGTGQSWPGGEKIAETIRNRNLKAVQELLDASPLLLHATDEHTNQPIHWAVMTRQTDMIDELLSRGADINAKRFDGAKPVQLVNGDYHFRGWMKDFPLTPIQVLEHLRSRGAYIDICTACAIGDIDRVKELLNEEPVLANRVSDYVTYYIGSGAPIKNAAASGHIKIVKILLEHGADPNLPEEGIAPYGHALHSAVCNGHIDIVRLLLDHGAYPNVEIESSADTLSAAIARNNKPMIELLCSYGAARKTHLLAYYGDILTAAAVFAANPEKADDTGALENAVSQGHEAFVRLMLHHQPHLPARIAVGVENNGPDDIVKVKRIADLLFMHGMDPNFSDWLGITPLHRFAKNGDMINAEIFIANGANVNARDRELCSTPLGWAARHGKTEMVKLLLKNGAETTFPNEPFPWATPLAWAIRKKHNEIIALLTQ